MVCGGSRWSGGLQAVQQRQMRDAGSMVDGNERVVVAGDEDMGLRGGAEIRVVMMTGYREE